MASCTLTVLSPLGSDAAKRITSRGVTPPAHVTLHQGVEAPVAGAADLFATLEALSQSPRVMIVRGAILPGVNRSSMRRAHATEPTLAEAARRWLLIDVDSWRAEIPADDFAADPAGWVPKAVAELPEAFQGAACWYQATASAGIKPGVRLRLAFWLSRPLTNAEIRKWIVGWRLPVDAALYTPSQPHYLARPICEAGVADPVDPALRSGILAGRTDTVEVPGVLDPGRSDAAHADLYTTARKVAKRAEGDRRNALNAAAYRLARVWAADELPRQAIEEALGKAALDAGLPLFEVAATIKSAVRDGTAKGGADRDGWRTELAFDDDGNARATAANVSLYLEHHPTFAGRIAFDERALRPLWVEGGPPWDGEVPRPVTEADEVRIVEWFQSQAGIQAAAPWVHAGVHKASEGRSFDPIQVYLRGLPEWDGVERASTFFIRHFQCEDTILTREQTKCWFISLYRRAFATLAEPVQADYMLVLCGAQGLRKGSVLRALCPDSRFFRDDLPPLDSKDARQAVTDAWIVELSELTHRKADRDVFKGFISARVDKFRRPYGRDEVVHPRRCGFAGTTNEPEFLNDPTGDRRFWVLTPRVRADVDRVIEEREQLWAEVAVYAERGDLAYLSHGLELEAEHVRAEHFEEDPAVDILRKYLERPAVTGPFSVQLEWEPDQLDEKRLVRSLTTHQAALIVGVPIAQVTQLGRVKHALRRLGWSEKRRRNMRRWYPPEGWEYTRGDTRHAQDQVS